MKGQQIDANKQTKEKSLLIVHAFPKPSVRVLGPRQASALFCRELCFLAGCLVYGMLHPKVPQPRALLELPSGICCVSQRQGYVLPITRRGWLGAGEAAVLLSSKDFAIFIHIPTEFEKHTREALLEAASELPAAPISLEPSTSLLLFFLVQDTVLLDSQEENSKDLRPSFTLVIGQNLCFARKCFMSF